MKTANLKEETASAATRYLVIIPITKEDLEGRDLDKMNLSPLARQLVNKAEEKQGNWKMDPESWSLWIVVRLTYEERTAAQVEGFRMGTIEEDYTLMPVRLRA